ncbi:MerR family transcriptional regulator [Subtercola boreus]|uniref:MerR family transcriptional regulator n=2 Tax=Subtercola boreus TaxID=120213 RepID=A0A3E0W5B1_9MICO|nr:MerR family transcriptional regulator [Subtercola boreus]
MTDAPEQMMQIGELAEKTSMSLRTIRHYDEVGILRPSGRSEGGFRLYTHSDFSRLMLIRRMKPLGFTLEEMAELLRTIDRMRTETDHDALVALRSTLADFVEQTTVRRARLEEQLGMADEFLELLRAQ